MKLSVSVSSSFGGFGDEVFELGREEFFSAIRALRVSGKFEKRSETLFVHRVAALAVAKVDICIGGERLVADRAVVSRKRPLPHAPLLFIFLVAQLRVDDVC